ncbi:MAG TPA: hypothetical protein VIG06_02860 [Kofleriaceae bacterium]|jgi:hypothetical protein
MTKNRKLRVLGRQELAGVQGGGMLIPAVQKIRDVAGPMSAGTIYLKFEGISGDATE